MSIYRHSKSGGTKCADFPYLCDMHAYFHTQFSGFLKRRYGDQRD